MLIYIVRHGQTLENLQRLMQGHMPGTLTNEGRMQMTRVAEYLAKEEIQFRCIVSSDLKRAMDSSEIIAERLGLAVVSMKILRERNWGRWTGMTITEAKDRFGKNGILVFPEGTAEREDEIYKRAKDALTLLKQNYADDAIIVVTHGQFARNMIAAYRGCQYQYIMPLINGEIRILY